jgi:phenylacetate-CoA ligase
MPGFEGLRWKIGRMKAMMEHRRALRDVPAYIDVVNREQRHRTNVESSGWDAVPVIDKFNYVRKYSPAECCHGGIIPANGVIIDESSGSTGMPTNWIRGKAERAVCKRMLDFHLGRLVGKGQRFIINTFALGPWATGINVSMAFSDSSILKSLGPDPAKIENTLSFFGNGYKYVIMGYPPFLKTLVDTASVNWSAMDITFIYGAEAMSESMRSYILSKGVKRVYGSYGASDLELSIAGENDFTIALRRLLEKNKELASQIIRHPGATPMILQYNPMDFHIESSAGGELLITLCRPTYLAPKIRYNIHDRGHVLRIPELRKLLKEHGIDLNNLGVPAWDFPLLFHYGRADMAVDFYGSRISPSDVQDALFRIPELASRINAFTIVSHETDRAEKRVSFSLECLPNSTLPNLRDNMLCRRLLDELMIVNQDFRESMCIAGRGAEPAVELHAYRTGPFVNSSARIKLNYITRIVHDPMKIASAV